MEYERKDVAILQEEFMRREHQLLEAGYNICDYNLEEDGKIITAVFQYGMFKIRLHLALADKYKETT